MRKNLLIRGDNNEKVQKKIIIDNIGHIACV